MRFCHKFLTFAVMSFAGPALFAAPPAGLPEVPVPEDNPMTEAKIELGKQLLALVEQALEAGVDPEAALEAAYRASRSTLIE